MMLTPTWGKDEDAHKHEYDMNKIQTEVAQKMCCWGML